MSPLLRKEIRLILPFWGIAIFLATMPVWEGAGSGLWSFNDFRLWTFGFGLMLMSLAPFGQEFSLGTFSVLLAQPIERSRIWRTKIVLIFFAALLVFGAFALTLHWRYDVMMRGVAKGFVETHALRPAQIQTFEAENRKGYNQEFQRACEEGFLVLLVATASGFWTTLLFRQTGAALWFAILIPGALYFGVEGLFHSFTKTATDVALAVILGSYSVAGLLWARRMFFEAQDAQWLGGTIALLGLNSKSQTATTTVRRKKPLAALIRKELQSHQISLLIAFGLLVLHLITLFFRKIDIAGRDTQLRFALESVPLLWLMLPWVMGSVAIAEERKLGTMESQLCLPVSRRLQFTTKLVVVLVLGIVLGGLVPFVLELAGLQAHIPSGIVQAESEWSLSSANGAKLATIAGIIGLISLFASSLTRNTLHALGASVVVGGIFVAIFQWLEMEARGYYTPWSGPLVLRLNFLVCLIAVICLSFINYRRLHQGGRVCLRNALTLFIVLICGSLAAAVIYQRPWELAMSLEPKHGPARLSGPVRPVIRTVDLRTMVLLPDGRLWAATDYEWQVKLAPDHSEYVNLAIPHSGTFVVGSNWVALVASSSNPAFLALQADGSLWNIISVKFGGEFWGRWLRAAVDPKRIGSDSDWKSIAAGQNCLIALKKDGSLWRIGADLNFEKMDIGSDWSQVFSGIPWALAVKQNGDVWELEEFSKGPQWVSLGINLSDAIDINASYGQRLVLRKDGSMWAWNGRDLSIFGARIPSNWVSPGNAPTKIELFRVGKDADWAQVIGGDRDIFGLKKDGRLIYNSSELFSTAFGWPSSYSDWLAIDTQWGNLIVLGADGTICQWENFRPDGSNELWLGPTRRPHWSLNIFANSKN